jgi:hypothetical protein
MLKEVSELAKKFSSVDEVKNELKRVQSIKCRLKKEKARKDYEVKMTEVVSYEQVLKEVRDYFEPKGTPVTMMTENEISKLNFDETMKAIKSIQSKKCNSQYMTDDIKTNKEYQDACKIEEMLLAHKKEVKPIEETVVKKSDIQNLINHFETLEKKIDKKYVIEQLQRILEA